VADAACDEPHEHLAGLRLREVDVLDDKRAPELLQDRGPDLQSATTGLGNSIARA
jgi:hypothetical protein